MPHCWSEVPEASVSPSHCHRALRQKTWDTGEKTVLGSPSFSHFPPASDFASLSPCLYLKRIHSHHLLFNLARGQEEDVMYLV